MTAQPPHERRVRPALAVLLLALARGAARLAVRSEVRDLSLVQAEAAGHPAQRKHRQVGERAEPAIADQQVASPHQRVQLPDLRLLVGIQREAEHLDDQAGERVEQPQHLGHGKAAAGFLAGRLLERLLQRRHVGRDRARAVNQQRPQPAP